MFIFPTMGAIALVGIELAFAHGLRLARSGVYPVKLAVDLGPLRGFEESCDGSARIVGELLGADAAVVAWIDQDLQELVPVAAAGFPERWLKTAPHLYLPESDTLKPSSERRDRRLLNSIGIAIGLSLDNARLYDQERERAERLQELARMKSDFLVTVSHELRTPLTSVKTAAEMLEEEDQAAPDSPRGQLVQNIVRGANRLSTLVADLMSMARLDTRELQLDMQPVGVGGGGASPRSLLCPLMIARHQALDTRFDTPGPTIVANRDRFEQILVNLLSNANRFAPAEGRIAVQVRADDDEVIISVSDTRPAIPHE